MIPEAHAATSVCVSVVLHDSDLDVLEPCLTCLAESLSDAQRRGVISRARVRLHDNASSDAYRIRLRELFERMQASAPPGQAWVLSLGDANPGFGAAHNGALHDANESYALILNPDVELAPDAIAVGLQSLESEAAAMALNPLCVRPDGERDYLCKRYPTVLDLALRGFAPAVVRSAFSARLGRYEYRDLPADALADVELLSGACLLCRMPVLHAINGFDERYFLYFEDFDLALRLRRFGVLRFEPGMQALHRGGFASRKGWRHRIWFIRSAVRFFRTHGWRLR